MARFEEGRSISCPPLFEGEAYFQWSNVMKYFILAQDIKVWVVIEKGYMEAPKKKKQRSENDTKAKLNSRAMHMLLYGLNEEVSKQVSTCKSAKDIWEKLEKLYGNKKEEKKDGVTSCANLLQSSKVDGVLALDEPEVSSNSSISCSYSFDELQDAYDKLVLEFENHILKNKKVVSNLKIQNDLISKTNDEFEAKLKEFEQNNVNLQNLLQILEKDHQKEIDDLKKEKDLISKECVGANDKQRKEHLKIVRLDQPNLTRVDSYAIIKGDAPGTQVKGDG
ncbi:hypothetical protein GQ457_16G003140 [Hibiscus cannabinus]